ncbi:MAG: leucine-rich repeat domain-containing protein, partial [Eubacteriales bacterium]
RRAFEKYEEIKAQEKIYPELTEHVFSEKFEQNCCNILAYNQPLKQRSNKKGYIIKYATVVSVCLIVTFLTVFMTMFALNIKSLLSIGWPSIILDETKAVTLETNDNTEITTSEVPNTAIPVESEDNFVIENGCLIKYLGERTTVTIPDEVTSINCDAFDGTSVEEIILPKNYDESLLNSLSMLSSIRKFNVTNSYEYLTIDGVLYTANMEELVKYPTGKLDESFTVPEGVIEISDSAFRGNIYIKNIVMNEELEIIRNNAFEGCSSLESVEMFNNLRYICMYAFAESGLREITLPDSITGVYGFAFYKCKKLESVTFSQRMDRLYQNVFEGCVLLKTVDIPDSVETIDTRCFSGCMALEEVLLSDSLTYLGSYVFEYCYGLKSIVLPNSLTRMQGETFSNCRNLESVTISYRTSRIDSDCFEGCNSLFLIKYSGTEAQWNIFVEQNSLNFSSLVKVEFETQYLN